MIAPALQKRIKALTRRQSKPGADWPTLVCGRLWRLFVACTLAVLVSRWTAAQAWQDITPPRLVVDAPDHLRAVADRVVHLDESSLLRVMQLIGVRGEVPPIVVVVAPEEWPVAQSTPRWIAGFANSMQRTVVIFPARSPSYPHDTLQDVLLHEIAHVLIAQAAGGAPVPRWFHEGLALAAERAWGLEDRTRMMMAVTLERRSFARLDEGFRAGEQQAARTYALSGAIVRDLMQDFGSDVGGRVLQRLAEGDSFDRAFYVVTGRTLLDAERDFWRESWWYHVVPFLTSSVVLWTAMIGLAVLARRARAQRRAQLRRRWEEAEAEQTASDREAEPPREAD